MKQIVFLSVVFVAMSIQLVHSAEAPALIERPGSGNGPTQVSVGIWIVDINNIDSAQQSFTADIAVVLRWKDARLAHTGTGAVHYALDQIWTPRVSIANETNSVVRKLPESAEAEPDGTVLYRQRYVGSFTQPLRLQSFPFDRQSFRIQFVAIRYRPNEVVFVADENWIRDGLQKAAGISPSITLARLDGRKMGCQSKRLFADPWLAVFGVFFRIHRFTQCRALHPKSDPAAGSDRDDVMVRFWTDPANSNTQFSVAVTSMLTLIAYRFAVDTQLPRLPYMTRLDVFFLISTLLVFFSLIEVLVTTILDNNRPTRASEEA